MSEITLAKLDGEEERLALLLACAARKIASLGEQPASIEIPGPNQKTRLSQTSLKLKGIRFNDRLGDGETLAVYFDIAAAEGTKTSKTIFLGSAIRRVRDMLESAGAEGPIIDWNRAQLDAAAILIDILNHRGIQNRGLPDSVIQRVQQGEFPLGEIAYPFLLAEPDLAA